MVLQCTAGLMVRQIGQRQKAPKRLPEWKFKRLVGGSKSAGSKIHWQTEDGEDCSQSDCTWQPRNSVPGDPSVVELDSSALCNATVSVEVASKMYKAVLHSMDDKGSAGPNSTSYYLKYKKKVGSRGKEAKANGWVDLELPVGENAVGGGLTATRHTMRMEIALTRNQNSLLTMLERTWS